MFYTVAEWNERKAVFHTVEAYLRAFSSADPVLLVVKTSWRDWRSAPPAGRHAVEPGTTGWALARILAAHHDPPPVSLVTRELGDDELSALHRRGDCYVSLCRSEGWGLGAFDAAVHDNPVVTTAFGGHMDYLHGSDLLVRYRLTPVQDPAGFPSYAPDQQWAEPDLDHAAQLLRHVLADPGTADRAAGLGERIRHRYRPTAVADTLRSVVEAERRARAPGARDGGAGSRPGSAQE